MSYMNYSPIPTKPMDIPLIVRTTNGPSIPILSNSFFDNIPNITSQFNISHVAKQNNVSKTDISKLTKINDGYGMLCDVVLPKFVQERIKYGKITNAFFTRVEVMSIGNILEPMKSGEENNNITCFLNVLNGLRLAIELCESNLLDVADRFSLTGKEVETCCLNIFNRLGLTI